MDLLLFQLLIKYFRLSIIGIRAKISALILNLVSGNVITTIGHKTKYGMKKTEYSLFSFPVNMRYSEAIKRGI